MKAGEKNKYLAELRNLYSSMNRGKLLSDPDDPEQIWKVNRIIAILKNFSSDIGKDLESQRDEFQRWCRAGERLDHSGNLLNDMFQFIGQKIEEMDVYDIKEYKPRARSIGILNRGKDNKFFDNKFTGLDVGIQDEGEGTIAAGNKFENKGVFIAARNIKNYGKITSEGKGMITRVIAENYEGAGEVSAKSATKQNEKWYQRWWGQAVLLIVTAVIAGIILKLIL